MADILALEWDAQQVSGVAAQVSRKSVNVKQTFVCDWPDKIDPIGNPRQAGDWLKQELARQGIEYREVVVALPREQVAIKPLELPSVPDDELPDVVRLQAATKSAMPIDQLKLDFIPAPRVEGSQTRRVWLATIPKKAFDRALHLVESAGLQLVGAGMSPTATASVIAQAAQKRSEIPAGVWLVISQRGTRVEISILRDQHILFSHAALLHGDNHEEQNRAILVDVNRCLVAAENEGALHGQKIAHVWQLGSEQENRSLVEALRRQFGCAVSTSLDPLTETTVEGAKAAISGESWSLAAPVGMLLSRAGVGIEAIDFVNPHRAPEKRDHRKMRAAIVAAGLILLVGWLFVDLRMVLGGLDQEVEELTSKKADLSTKNEKGKTDREAAQAIEQWLELKVDWIGQFSELVQNFSDANGIYLNDFRVTPPSRGEVAGIKATGFARKEDDIRALYRRLYEHNYQANPYPPPQKTQNNPEYPFQFELNIELLRGRKALPPPPPPAAVTVPPKEAEAKGNKEAETEKKGPEKKEAESKGAEEKVEKKQPEAEAAEKKVEPAPTSEKTNETPADTPAAESSPKAVETPTNDNPKLIEKK